MPEIKTLKMRIELSFTDEVKNAWVTDEGSLWPRGLLALHTAAPYEKELDPLSVGPTLAKTGRMNQERENYENHKIKVNTEFISNVRHLCVCGLTVAEPSSPCTGDTYPQSCTQPMGAKRSVPARSLSIIFLSTLSSLPTFPPLTRGRLPRSPCS